MLESLQNRNRNHSKKIKLKENKMKTRNKVRGTLILLEKCGGLLFTTTNGDLLGETIISAIVI
jgi:hypothetical protein